MYILQIYFLWLLMTTNSFSYQWHQFVDSGTWYAAEKIMLFIIFQSESAAINDEF